MAAVFARPQAGGGPEPRRGNARRPVDRRSRPVRRDQHRRHVRPAGGGCRAGARAAGRGARGVPVPARLDRRGLRLARRRRVVQRGDPVRAELALRGEQGVSRSPGARLLPHLRAAGDHHELLEQLRPVSVSGEADSADDPERAGRPAAADLRRRRQRARLAARRGSLRGDPAPRSSRGSLARSTTSAAAASGRTCRSSIACARRSTRSCPRGPTLRSGAPAATHRSRRSYPIVRGTTGVTRSTRGRSGASSAGVRGTTSTAACAPPSSGTSANRAWCAAVQAGRYDRQRLGLTSA